MSGISLDNFGTVLSRNISGKGSQAVDFSDVASANSVNNHAHGELRAIDADALRPGNQGIVVNAGKIVATVEHSNKNIAAIAAIDTQQHSGIRVTNASGGLIDGARHGLTGGTKTTSASRYRSPTRPAPSSAAQANRLSWPPANRMPLLLARSGRSAFTAQAVWFASVRCVTFVQARDCTRLCDRCTK